ncbi:hypothetical protein CHIBA101_2350 [Actinomyces sp. Chiba101]|uniref:DUF4194 domain-containing protein n=1 Tax=Actinomyces TaxID=1654 RepID=UPI000974F1F7|nr:MULTISPECIES: DUF4194 domain-containing protein [Actinomyces]BAW94171.1 hypothetical protein CHIBA101_2350 [Actinomyces sp. Chiba101]SUU13485.1 Uncharacterised protein [Actinomyces denticolens]
MSPESPLEETTLEVPPLPPGGAGAIPPPPPAAPGATAAPPEPPEPRELRAPTGPAEPAEPAEPMEPAEPASEMPPGALWDGDAGTLPRDTRRAIVRLVQGPYLSAALHPELWQALMADLDAVRHHLANMFLGVIVDREAGFAFVRNCDDPTGQAPSVVRAMPLTLIDTALLLHLRTLLLRTMGAGQRVFVDRSELIDHLAIYRRRASTDLSGFERRVSASIAKMTRASLLQATSVDERYEISPILALVFGADQVTAVAAQYEAMLREDDDHGAGDAPGARAPRDPQDSPSTQSADSEERP